jgi:oligoendopeptidase F
MAARKPLARNNHLEEAMALLIRNQAAFVEQIARNDQERLALREWQHRTEVWQYKTEEWQRKTEVWQRKAEERFDKIEKRLSKIEESLVQLPKTILQSLLEQLPKAVKKEIGFTSPS